MRPTKLVSVGALSLTLALSGCAIHRPHQPLATQAMGFNLTVEEAQNEMLLLNVIRAKDRLPMYLTAISTLNGNLSTGLEASLGGSYTDVSEDTFQTQTPPGALATVTNTVKNGITRGFTPSVKGTRSRNPNFTLGVLDGQDFTRGFLSPIDQRTFAYFWDQGWPPELLMYLLVHEVEVKRNDGSRSVFKNYPDPKGPELGDLQCFALWVKEFVARRPELREETTFNPVGPPVREKNLQDISKLIGALKEGFDVEAEAAPAGDASGTGEEADQLNASAEPPRWRLRRKVVSYRLQYTKPSQQAEPADGDSKEMSLKQCVEKLAIPGKQQRTATGGTAETDGMEHTKAESTAAAPAKEVEESLLVSLASDDPTTLTEESASRRGIIGLGADGGDVNIVLRSPEAVLYYLGELARVATRDDPAPKVPNICVQNEFQPLFVALNKNSNCDDALVEVRASTGSYVIPGELVASLGKQKTSQEDGCSEGSLWLPPTVECHRGRSMQAFRLLSQLISLQKSAEELPSPALVRVIGE